MVILAYAGAATTITAVGANNTNVLLLIAVVAMVVPVVVAEVDETSLIMSRLIAAISSLSFWCESSH